MCTSIVEVVAVEGMAKRGDDWFELTQVAVAYDHARHAVLGDVITLDFVNAQLPPGARAAVEITLESAKALRDALDRAIAAAEIEEAERADGLERARAAAMAANVHDARRCVGHGNRSKQHSPVILAVRGLFSARARRGSSMRCAEGSITCVLRTILLLVPRPSTRPYGRARSRMTDCGLFERLPMPHSSARETWIMRMAGVGSNPHPAGSSGSVPRGAPLASNVSFSTLASACFSSRSQ